MILLGLLHHFLGRRATNPFPDPAIDDAPTAASYAQALYAGLWSFDGFNQANYVAGEMRNPTCDIPHAIHSSMALVAVRLRLRLHHPSSSLTHKVDLVLLRKSRILLCSRSGKFSS